MTLLEYLLFTVSKRINYDILKYSYHQKFSTSDDCELYNRQILRLYTREVSVFQPN
jgi:hypothetical protein